MTVELLLSAFNPLHAFLLALMVNARHLFYGLSMLQKYRSTGWKKFYLIFGMCDESFSINCTVNTAGGVNRGWFMFFVTLFNHIYWVAGATAGALLGYVIHFDTTGIEFVMTALFVVMFLNQWEEAKDHHPRSGGAGLLSGLPAGLWQQQLHRAGHGPHHPQFPAYPQDFRTRGGGDQ